MPQLQALQSIGVETKQDARGIDAKARRPWSSHVDGHLAEHRAARVDAHDVRFAFRGVDHHRHRARIHQKETVSRLPLPAQPVSRGKLLSLEERCHVASGVPVSQQLGQPAFQSVGGAELRYSVTVEKSVLAPGNAFIELRELKAVDKGGGLRFREEPDVFQLPSHLSAMTRDHHRYPMALRNLGQSRKAPDPRRIDQVDMLEVQDQVLRARCAGRCEPCAYDAHQVARRPEEDDALQPQDENAVAVSVEKLPNLRSALDVAGVIPPRVLALDAGEPAGR